MRIITITDSPTIFSGLARVHRNAIDGLLERGHEVVPCGWFAYDSDQLAMLKNGEKPPEIYYESPFGKVRVLCVPKRQGNMNEMYAVYDIIDVVKPDAVITIGDIWTFYYMQAIKVKAGFGFSWIPYLTVESEVTEQWKALLKYADRIAVASEYGRGMLSLAGEGRSSLVEYGTDGFCRLDEDRRRRIRQKKGSEGKVRFLAVGQNTWRKNLPSILQAVRILKEKDTFAPMDGKVEFHLRTNIDPMDKQEESLYDLRKLVSAMDLDKWVTFPEGPCSIFEAPPDEDLLEEYNASDFLVSASTSEGYGLPIVEGMACGLPVVANPSSCVRDHLGEVEDPGTMRCRRGFEVETVEQICPPCRFARVTDPQGLADALFDAFLFHGNELGMERMRQECINYGKERTWNGMKKLLCDMVESTEGRASVVVEEL